MSGLVVVFAKWKKYMLIKWRWGFLEWVDEHNSIEVGSKFYFLKSLENYQNLFKAVLELLDLAARLFFKLKKIGFKKSYSYLNKITF